MAIKIKNKGKKDPEEPEEDGQGGVPPGNAPGSGLDGFERIGFSMAAWVEDNRGLFLGMVGMAFVAVIAIIIGVVYVRGQQMEASERLSEGLTAYEKHVEDTPHELEQLWANQPGSEPTDVFETTEQRWQEVYDHADNTLQDFDGGAIAASARMTKAAAAMNLELYDESQQLYREVVDGGDASEEFMATAYMGLANSLAAQGNLADAEEAWQKFAELRPAQQAYSELEIARMYERHGDPDEAIERYERFVDEHPESEHLGEVERRKALLTSA